MTVVAAVLLGLAALIAATALALSTPRLGLELAPADDGGVVIEHDAAGALKGERLLSIAAGDRIVLPLSDDLIEEPDVIDSFPGRDRFMERQQALAGLLAQEAVQLRLRQADGAERRIAISPCPARIGDLPFGFWFQVGVGFGGLLISAWVWAMRPGDWAARMFALTGLAMLIFTHAAAIYSTRELALDAGLFRVLTGANYVGASLFGVAMINVFLSYPKRLAPPAGFLVAPLIFGIWGAAGMLRLLPDVAISYHLPIVTEMALIVAAILAQAIAVRKDPASRAALLWLGLSVTIGAGAFVAMMAAPQVLGFAPAMPQGYAFGFFLLIHAGVALGLRRYRLFDLKDWAFTILFYAGAAAAFVVLDVVLVMALPLEEGPALGLSLLVVAFAYLPLRDWLWRRMVARRTMEDHELFNAVIEVAFGGTRRERGDRWRELLNRLFEPLEITPTQAPIAAPSATEDGLCLTVPATADSPALVLQYPWRGRGLFGRPHLKLARQLASMMSHVQDSREAYERGVSEERHRIARDLHDDVGARLLSGLHTKDLPATREAVRDALGDIRVIVSGMTGDGLPLSQVIADLRHETARRLEVAGLELDWATPDADDSEVMLDYRTYRALISAHREMISNAIRHAQASRVSVTIAAVAGRLRTVVSDDGVGMSERTSDGPGGSGLRNMVRRVRELGGELTFPDQSRGAGIALSLPLAPA
ncbi:sensor histidine kinase [Caulobacter sp. NIBR2454]|uniref:sensor histidine kinase n=1 Tax=Caulobacter sp. NIBR2454 TaxID=3015996 RepID=UPI0022B6C769|nr:ATP-binding protein [Caulobacter sp. NIBR2454]